MKSAVTDFKTFETTQSNVRGPTDDSQIEIDISESQTRFRIATSLAKESGLDFDSFVKFVEKRADPDSPEGSMATRPSDSSV